MTIIGRVTNYYLLILISEVKIDNFHNVLVHTQIPNVKSL